MLKNAEKLTIDINLKFKEKNRSSRDYKAVMLAWFKGLSVFRDTLKQLDSKALISSDLLIKLTDKFDLFYLDYQIEDLRKLKVSSPVKEDKAVTFADLPPSNSSSVVEVSPSDSLTLVRPRSLSKDELKEKIVELAGIQDQPDFNFDLLVTATRELLNHPDVTADEKSRYEVYFNEVVEYRNYKKMEKMQQDMVDHPPIQAHTETPASQQPGFTPIPAPSQSTSFSPFPSPSQSPAPEQSLSSDYAEDRSTSISKVRMEMAQQLSKLRSMYKVQVEQI